MECVFLFIKCISIFFYFDNPYQVCLAVCISKSFEHFCLACGCIFVYVFKRILLWEIVNAVKELIIFLYYLQDESTWEDDAVDSLQEVLSIFCHHYLYYFPNLSNFFLKTSIYVIPTRLLSLFFLVYHK